MEDNELQELLNDVTNMVNNLMCVNLEVWMVKRQQLEEVCRQADEKGLLALHEDVSVRLLSAMN